MIKDTQLATAEKPWFEEPTSDDTGFGVPGMTQNHPGHYAYTPGDAITSNVALTPGGTNCADVFVRMNTCPGSNPTATPPVLGTCGSDPYDNAGNRLWSFPGLILNPYGALDVTATIPSGYTYTVSCTNDDVSLPQTAGCGPAPSWSSNATYRIGRSAGYGGFIWRSLVNGPPVPTNKNIIPGSDPTYWAQVCASHTVVINTITVHVCDTPIIANNIFTSANVFHGSSVTVKFTAPPETPCPAGTFTSQIANATGVGEEKWPAHDPGDILVRYDQFPAPNDNSYGVNAVGWPNGHTFGNLTGSDKAGIQIKDPNGVVKLSFNMDYLSAKTGTPSGYASLGVTGGDGGMVTGTAAGISVTTSLANNLNGVNGSAGFCVALNCTVGGVNLLVNSPPTVNNTSYALPAGSPFGAWDFHDTYYAVIKASANPALAGFNFSTWSVEPNLTVLHNSPAKPCPTGPFDCSKISVGNTTLKDKEVKVDVNNDSQTQDAYVTGVHITWPTNPNGALLQIKIGGDVIWTGSNATGTADIPLAQLAADAGKRKIGKNSDEDVKFIFANNAAAPPTGYTASLDFGDNCNKPIIVP